MSPEPLNLLPRVVEETRRRVRNAEISRVVFDMAREMGFDTSCEPTLEQVKSIFVAAVRAARNELVGRRE